MSRSICGGGCRAQCERLGPGDGTLSLIGDNLTAAVSLGSFAQMRGILTVTSADGLPVTAEAGLGHLTITGTGFSGSFEHDFTVELFRAVFLPIRLHPSWDPPPAKWSTLRYSF